MSTIRRRSVPPRRRRDGLIRFAKDITSQNGEDGIIDRIFHLLPPPTNGELRHCVDVGAWDGDHLSNTRSLFLPSASGTDGATDCTAENFPRWRGVLIEADFERFQSLDSLHGPLGNTCIHSTVSCHPYSAHSLSSLLRRHAPDLPLNFDFICIDVDGTDYWILHDILVIGKYRPQVLCIEFNPTIPDDVIYIQSQSDSIREGSSLAALCELTSEHGYVLVETTLYNAFFVEESLYQAHLTEEVPEPTIEALHQTTMGTSLYQLYDGTLKLSGCRKLLWHRVPIEEETIQVLTKEKRVFPFAPPQPGTMEEDAERQSDEMTQKMRDLAVDMTSYCKPTKEGSEPTASSEGMKACADQLWKQLQSDGFALVRGTGIPRDVCRDAIKATDSFLQEANESVRRSCLTKDRARRGYSPMCTENFASLVGERGPNDLVRKFRVGPLHSEAASDDDAQRPPTSPLLRPNIWPDVDAWSVEQSEFFRISIERYYEMSCRAAHEIVRAICDGVIGANPDLTKSMDVLSMKDSVAHTSILTLLGYRTGSRHKKGNLTRPLVAPHTDVGVITFLLFDRGDCAELQRADNNCKKAVGSSSVAKQDWVDVALPSSVPDDPIFVVNIGDCLSELSNGALPSTLHRVMPLRGSTPRNCLALFVGLDPTEVLSFPNGEAMQYEDWRRRRIARAAKVLSDLSSKGEGE